jgi:hypothetical protein
MLFFYYLLFGSATILLIHEFTDVFQRTFGNQTERGKAACYGICVMIWPVIFLALALDLLILLWKCL